MRSKRTSQIVNTSKSPNLDKELKRLIFDTRDVNHTLGFEESPAKNESVPYFKDDSYNVNAYNQFLNQTNKCFVKSRAVNDHLEKANRIVEYLMERHKEAKSRLQKLKEYKDKAYYASIEKMNFRPKILKCNRYPIRSSLFERNKGWEERRSRNFTTEKEKITVERCQYCTFSPYFVSRQKSERILKDRKYKMAKLYKEKTSKGYRLSEEKEKRKKFYINEGESMKAKKHYTRSSADLINFSTIKELIRKELNKIPI